MRKTLTYVWSLLCLCCLTTIASAQNGLYDVRFAIKNFDCMNNKVTIQVQVKSHDAAHTFLMGDANYRFDYDPRVIKNPTIVSQENFSNQAPAVDFNYNAQNINGSSAGLTLGTVSLNTIYGGGGNAAKLVPTTWTTVSCIKFDVQDATKCINLTWHNNNRFPITGMNEIVLLGSGNYDLFVVESGGIFINYSECIPSVCSSIIALNDINATLKNVPVSGNLLTNDISATAMTATTTPLNAPLHGIVTIAANGAYTYTPTTGFVGQDSAQYKVCNVAGLCDTAWLYLNILDTPVGGVNSAPIAQNDNGVTYINTLLTGNVLNNDFDPEGNTLTVNTTPLTSPKNGMLVLNPNGTFTYTPNNAFVGQDTFRYVVCDNGVPSKCDTASVVVNILNNTTGGTGNQPPTPADDAYETYKNVTVNGNLKINDTDPNVGQTLLYATTPTVAPLHGTVTITAAGTFVYVPTTGYTGPDEFVYTVCDNGSPIMCANATVHILVTAAPNEKPVVTVTPKTINEDTTITFCLPIIDPNTTDTHTVTACTAPTGGGTATAVVDNVAHTLCITYRSALNYNGQDTVCFLVCDNGSPSKCDSVKVPITVAPVNDKPVIGIAPVTVKEDTTITLCFPVVDPEGNALTSTPCGAKNGTITSVITAGQVCITYSPAPNYFGPDTLCVIVCDNGVPSKCDTAKIPVTVTPVNDKPIVPDLTTSTPNTTTTTACVLITDMDATDTHTLSLCGTPTLGYISSVVNNVTHQLCITYTPTAGAVGTDHVCVIVCDNGSPSKCDTIDLTFIVGSTNDKPIAMNDINITFKNVPVSGNVKTNDSDPNNHTLTVNTTPVQAPINGTIVLNSNGTYTYTPNPTFVGTETIKYQVCDNGSPSLCDTASLVIEVQAGTNVGNPKPVATDDNTTTPAGQSIIIAVKANDYDPQGGIIGNPTLFGTPIGGIPTVRPDGTVNFVPTSGFIGTAIFTYYVCDNGLPSLCDSAMVTIDVYKNPLEGNVSPVAIDDAFPVKKDTPFTGTVTTNDLDPNAGDVLTYGQTTSPIHGAVSLLSNGQIVYTPTTGFVGIDSFKYQVCDNGSPSMCDTAVVIFNITTPIVPPTNLAPVATDDVTSTVINTPITIPVKANDYDPNGGQTLTNPTIVGTPVGGTAVVNPDGTITFTPTVGFTGPATIVYQVCDNGTPLMCDNAMVTVNVIPTPPLTNLPPTAGNDAATTPLNTILTSTVATNDRDPDAGQLLTFTRLTPPNNGISNINPTTGVYTYNPLALFTGIDSFQYKVCDNGNPSLCDTAWVFVTVAPPIGFPNVAPTANDDNTATLEGKPITINVKANDFDLNPNTILGNPTVVGTPVGGTPVVNPNGTVTFTPTLGFVGTATFKYQICDNGTPSLCDTATVTIDISKPNNFVNIAPIAIKDAATTKINTPVAGNAKTNDWDINVGQTLTYATTPVTNPLNGTITIQTDGTYVYTPATGFVGIDSAQYRVCDSYIPSLCATAWIVIEVTPLGVNNNLPPVVTKDNAATTKDVPVIINVKANDYDPNTGQTLGNPTIVGTVPNGTATVNPDGTITFAPAPGFTGTTSFTYQVCDNGFPSSCGTAVVTAVVGPKPPTPYVNLKPVAGDDAFQTVKNAPVSGSIATNDTDPNAGQTLTYGLLDIPAHGIVTVSPSGVYSYTPVAGYIGSDHFTYQVCDSGTPSLCDTATVYLTVYDVPCVTMNLKVLLEGSLYQSPTAGIMRTTLNERGLLPGQTPIGQFAVATPAGHPYGVAPWNLVDTTGITKTTYDADVTDWVLVSLRTDNTSANSVLRVPALLTKDGIIKFVNPCFTIANGNYFVVIEHRNHLGIMSPNAVPIVNGAINFDFTTGNTMLANANTAVPAFGQKTVGTKWAMHAGDGKKNTTNTNFDINFNDSVLWRTESGIFDQYRYSDFDMNADLNFQDQVLWKSNNGRYSNVPH